MTKDSYKKMFSVHCMGAFKQLALKQSENEQGRPWDALNLLSAALDHFKAVGSSLGRLSRFKVVRRL